MKKGLILSLSLFFAAIIIDLFLKAKMMDQLGSHLNRGFIFGSLQDLPASLTLVTLTSFGGFLVFIYLILIVLLASELVMLKIGLGLLTGGILGNVIDRALHGGTLDFIPLNIPSLPSIVFNPADVFQWIGAAFIAINLFTKEDSIWYPDNQRGFSLINKKEQIKFALKFSALSLCTCLIIGIFSFSYFTLTLQANRIESRSTVIAFAISYVSITLFFAAVTFLAGLVLSQRTAGPLYAFEKYVEELLAGEDRELKLREGDNFRHLENVAQRLRQHLKK